MLGVEHALLAVGGEQPLVLVIVQEGAHIAQGEVPDLAVVQADVEVGAEEVQGVLHQGDGGVVLPLGRADADVGGGREGLARVQGDALLVAGAEDALRLVGVGSFDDGANDDMDIPAVGVLLDAAGADERGGGVVRGEEGQPRLPVLRQGAGGDAGTLVREEPGLPLAGDARGDLDLAQPYPVGDGGAAVEIVAVVTDAGDGIVRGVEQVPDLEHVVEGDGGGAGVGDAAGDGVGAAAEEGDGLGGEFQGGVGCGPGDQFGQGGLAVRCRSVRAEIDWARRCGGRCGKGQDQEGGFSFHALSVLCVMQR